MDPKRRGTIQGLLWVSCVLFQLNVLVKGQSSSTMDGETFNATIAGIERTRRFELSRWGLITHTFALPVTETTNPDAVVTLSPIGHVDVDIFCFPGDLTGYMQARQNRMIAPWRSNHTHGDDFAFISQHHPRYADGLVEREDGDVVVVTCEVRSNEDHPVSVQLNIDLDYETIEMRQEDEEALESIFNKCCQSEDSCKEWKEHRSNEGSVQSDLCHFHTNVCNSDGHLYRLSLENLNMQCEFPYEEITQLKQLKKLLLKGNKFTGNVGRVLEELSNLSDLEDIDISDSQLTGSFVGNSAVESSGICTLASSDLLYLNLERNNITGELPACLLYSRSRVKTINLAFNKITGKLPRVSGFSRELEALDLTGNQLTGEIPASYTEESSLEMLYLSRNRLTRIVLGAFGISQSLIAIDLSGNKLSGTFPERFTFATALRILDLSNNRLTGELPDSIGRMARLGALILASNEFTGSLPSSLGSLRVLQILALNNNNFTGQIPETYRDLFRLQYFNLRNNSLTGSIKNVLPSSLLILDLRHNQLTGEIPATIFHDGIGEGARQVLLSNNNFDRFDDEWYGERVQMRRLILFHAAHNNINGSFPSLLADAVFLRRLDLSSNDLSGPLPSEAGIFEFLILLNLSSNAFTGSIPESWENSGLFAERSNSTVDLSFNQLTGPIPDFLYEIPTNGEVNKTIDLEGNDFDLECPLPKRLASINGLVCNPDYSALAPFAEASLIDIEGDLPKSLFDMSAESSIEAPEAFYVASTINDTMSTARNTSTRTRANTTATTVVDGRGEIETSTQLSSNKETTGEAETQSDERGSNQSNINVLWIPAVVVFAFAVLLAVFLVIRKLSISRKAAAAGGGRKPVPLISLSTLESSKALPPQREPSRDDSIHMLTGVQSSAEI